MSNKRPSSQVMELFLQIAQDLGCATDREVAELAGVTPENVAYWRSGQVREFKTQTLQALKELLGARLRVLREHADLSQRPRPGLSSLEVEEGSSPSDLQRQFQERVNYDYLGHRFLYYEPQGALAWEKLIGVGYDQDRWVSGTERCAAAWLDLKLDSQGDCQGPIAHALGLDRRGRARGLDVISLGCGEGGKELRVLRSLLELKLSPNQQLPWLSFAPVDVSIPLLLTCAGSARTQISELKANPVADFLSVLPFCADFEEGRLAFAQRLPSTEHPAQQGVRLVMLLGNIFGNLRDEEGFIRQRLVQLARPGDLVWLEIGLRPAQLRDEPLFALTQPNRSETSAETNRRILLEGPYRRWEAAMGRRPAAVEMRVWVREDDESCRVPGSVNFCHDLHFTDDRRTCTMLYSRRYDIQGFTQWIEKLGFQVERLAKVEDLRQVARVVHVLLRRR